MNPVRVLNGRIVSINLLSGVGLFSGVFERQFTRPELMLYSIEKLNRRPRLVTVMKTPAIERSKFDCLFSNARSKICSKIYFRN